MRIASGQRQSGWTIGVSFALLAIVSPESGSAVLEVPGQFPGIQAAINAATNGDTVLMARGTHGGGLTIAGKAVTLASRFILTGDPADARQTSIEGGNPILLIQSSAGAATTLRGLTFRGGSYHVVNHARRISVLDCRFSGGANDQLSFEAGGGLVQNCRFENAGDDGVDSDDASDPTVLDNVIVNAKDDGIEVRLHAYTGPTTLQVLIRNNFIAACLEDGIQLIDYAGASNRVIRIEGNLLLNNAKAGIGCMANGNTTENFAGAPLVEPVYVIGNTISWNPYGITGGDNMLVMNNVIQHAGEIGVKRVAGASLVAYNSLWYNGLDLENANVDPGTTLVEDPLLDPNFYPQSGSPCIDAGAPALLWTGSNVTAPPYQGAAPDLGAKETAAVLAAGGAPAPRGLSLAAPRPNPARGEFTVGYGLAGDSPARIELLDLAGRRVAARVVDGGGSGSSIVRFSEARDLPAGIYLVRLSQGGRFLTRRVVVIR
jgi:hypothetical protein